MSAPAASPLISTQNCLLGLLTLLVLTIAPDCAFGGATLGDTIKPEDVAFIRLHQTTFAEVMARLGTPDELLESETEVIAVYRLLDALYSRINYGSLASAWSPVTPDLITEGLGMRLNRLTIRLSPTWIVHHIEFSNQPEQPSGFTLVPFVH